LDLINTITYSEEFFYGLTMSSKIKLIAGEWRGRNIKVLELEGLRPTPIRVRETLFNWLQYDVLGSRCLDLYAGSGALGLEAASRGATQVVQVDNHHKVCQQLHENTQLLTATDKVKVVKQDVMRYLAGDAERFNVVFLDPPFFKDLASQAMHWLEDKGWLLDGAKIYVEVERSLELKDTPENWQCLKHKTAGQVSYYLFERV